MNREIKFKGMSINGKWHIGLISTSTGIYSGMPESGLYMSNRAGRPFAWKMRPETVGQFTGMLDMNGNEIYEGDIVRILYTDWPSNPAPNNEGLEEYKKSISNIGEVVFDKGEFKLKMKCHIHDFMNTSIDEGKHGEKEVIGNVHQKALAKEKEDTPEPSNRDKPKALVIADVSDCSRCEIQPKHKDSLYCIDCLYERKMTGY